MQRSEEGHFRVSWRVVKTLNEDEVNIYARDAVIYKKLIRAMHKRESSGPNSEAVVRVEEVRVR